MAKKWRIPAQGPSGSITLVDELVVNPGTDEEVRYPAESSKGPFTIVEEE